MIISVIIPVYEQWDQVPLLCAALGRQSLPRDNFEVIIIDNGSALVPDLTVTNTSISFLECKKPGSYAARNAGLELANGELVVFTDADCLPEDDWLERLQGAYQKSDKNTLLAGSVVIRSDNHNPNTAELYNMVAGLPQERYVRQGYAVTANLAIPRKVFDEIGLFDDRRFSGGDADFCTRALKSGFSLEYIPNAIVYHPARASWAEFSTKIRRIKGGQIRAGKLSRRLKYFFITLVPPVWRLWRTLKNQELDTEQRLKVCGFQMMLWGVEVFETAALLLGKKPERR